jgi:ribosome-associated translation inhibitor RaiA
MDCGHGNGDHVGVRLCTALRDEIAKSARYYETNSETGLQFNLHLVSVGDDSESATALVLTFQGEEKGAEETYVDVWATITGGTKVASQADDVFAAIDDQIQKLINRARKQPAS